MQPIPAMNQHHTTAEAPPDIKGYEKVVIIVENNPLILTAKENVEK